jgi:hypothetical protein
MLGTDITEADIMRANTHTKKRRKKNRKPNTVALVCKQTIPIQQLLIVGEVSANFCR